MSAIAKNPDSHLLQSAAQQLQRELPTSSKFIRAMGLSEMGQLTEIAKFLIFVAVTGEDGVAQLQTTNGDSFPGNSPSMNILEALRYAETQPRDNQTRENVVVGDVKVNFSTMEADRRGEPLLLTTLEFKTLRYLVENPRRVISRDELLNEVWGYNNYPSTRTVDNQVAKLRKKLELNPAQPVHLRTVYGAGYKFLP